MARIPNDGKLAADSRVGSLARRYRSRGRDLLARLLTPA